VGYKSNIPIQLATEDNMSNIAGQLAIKHYQAYISWVSATHPNLFWRWEEWGDSIKEESRAHEERISHTEPGNEDTGKGQDEDEDTDKGQDEEEDTNKEQDEDMSGSTNDSDEEDLDSDLVDKEVLNDNEILNEEGFAEL